MREKGKTLDERIAFEIDAAIQAAKSENGNSTDKCWALGSTGYGQDGYYEPYRKTGNSEDDIMESAARERERAWALAVVSPSGEVTYTFHNRDVIDYENKMDNRNTEFKIGDLVLFAGFFYGFIKSTVNKEKDAYWVKSPDDEKLAYKHELIVVNSPEWDALLKITRPYEVEQSVVHLWYLTERMKLNKEFENRMDEINDKEQKRRVIIEKM